MKKTSALLYFVKIFIIFSIPGLYYQQIYSQISYELFQKLDLIFLIQKNNMAQDLGLDHTSIRLN